jgi:hypothetical protein
MEKDLKLTSTEYSVVLLVFFVGSVMRSLCLTRPCEGIN